MNENQRLSIVEEIAGAFALSRVSVATLQQAFFNRNDDEIFDFVSNCPADVAATIQRLGFTIPQPLQSGSAPTETAQQISAWNELTTETQDISKLFGL